MGGATASTACRCSRSTSSTCSRRCRLRCFHGAPERRWCAPHCEGTLALGGSAFGSGCFLWLRSKVAYRQNRRRSNAARRRHGYAASVPSSLGTGTLGSQLAADFADAAGSESEVAAGDGGDVDGYGRVCSQPQGASEFMPPPPKPSTGPRPKRRREMQQWQTVPKLPDKGRSTASVRRTRATCNVDGSFC